MKNSPITSLKEGASGKITRFTDEEMAGKLMAMGVLPGSSVEIVKRAPFKGGYYLKVDGNSLAVRAREAGNILVEL